MATRADAAEGGRGIATRTKLTVALALAAALAACGCTLHSSASIAGSGSLSATPPGPSAVLQVTVPYNTQVAARGADWGIIRTQNPDARFADLVAHAAREDAGLDVIPPFKAMRALEDAELHAGLHPEPAQMPAAARALRCASFLTADVVKWHCAYVFFTSSSVIEFDLACHAAEDGRKLWDVHVSRRTRGLSDGEVARLALAEAFRWLQQNDPAGGAPAAEAEAP